jgi:hypothetical protein
MGEAASQVFEMGLLNSNPAVLGHFPPSLCNREATVSGGRTKSRRPGNWSVIALDDLLCDFLDVAAHNFGLFTYRAKDHARPGYKSR